MSKTPFTGSNGSSYADFGARYNIQQLQQPKVIEPVFSLDKLVTDAMARIRVSIESNVAYELIQMRKKFNNLNKFGTENVYVITADKENWFMTSDSPEKTLSDTVLHINKGSLIINGSVIVNGDLQVNGNNSKTAKTSHMWTLIGGGGGGCTAENKCSDCMEKISRGGHGGFGIFNSF